MLEYAAPVWHGSLTKEEALTLERRQASVARQLLKAPWDTPKAEMLFCLDSGRRYVGVERLLA